MQGGIRLEDILNQRLRNDAVHPRAGRNDVVEVNLVLDDNQRTHLAARHMLQRENHLVDNQLGVALPHRQCRAVKYGVVAQLFQNAPDFGLKQHNQQHRPGVDHPREQSVNGAHAEHVAQPCGQQQNDDTLDGLRHARLPDVHEQLINDDGQQQDIDQVDQTRPVEYVPQDCGYLFPNRVQGTSSHL